MSGPLPLRSRYGSRDGIALVMVLAFIVLLTILVVSFISYTRLNRLSTASYGNAIQAQEVARGGLQEILSDLHQEIIAGSTNNPAVYTQGGTTIYVPSTNLTAVPTRVGYAANLYTNNVSASYLPPTLVRVSRASQDGTATDFYPNFTTNAYFDSTLVGPLINRASAAKSSTSSVNGRLISAARWNEIQLLSTNGTIPPPFSTNTPDWVYVTRTGSRVCSAATPNEIAQLKPSSNLTQNYGTIIQGQNPPVSPVLGRYAFVMYDEGALLDANIAGYIGASTNLTSTPSDLVTGMTQSVNGKSYLSYADLTELPGLIGNQPIIDNLVNWRNASASSSGNNYLIALISYAKNGFLTFQAGDSPLLGREDLINYFANIDPHINTASATYSQALPYLGTFSRAVSAPSWTPITDSQNMTNYVSGMGTPVPYKTKAETTGTVNRDLANVRFTTAGTVTHYYDDQSSTSPAPSASYTVNIGDPLLQNRFSLAKINWLSQVSPQPSDGKTTLPMNYVAPIQKCFGLVWDYPGGNSSTTANGGNKCWNYVGPTGNSGTPATAIETLDQVAAENPPREPNFFELLKASILSGSLGRSAGPSVFNNGVDSSTAGTGGMSKYDWHDVQDPAVDGYGSASLYSYTFGPATTVPVPARIPDVQIIQIGANIIDQYDADSYPTAIYFKYSGVDIFDPVSGANGNPIFGPVTMVYGQENLPLLNRIVQQVCSPNRTGSTPETGATDNATNTFGGWFQPELWNPYLKPSSALLSSPKAFQIRAYGSGQTFWYEGSTPAPGAANLTPPYNNGLSPVVNYYQTNLNTENVPAGTINFTDSSTTSSFYLHPFLLTKDTIPGVVADSPYAGNVAQSNFPYYNDAPGYISPYAPNFNHFVAFSAGVTSPQDSGGSYRPFFVSTTGGVAGVYPSPAPATFTLGWVDSASQFHPYSFIPGVFLEDYSQLYLNYAPDLRVGSVNADGNGEGSTKWSLADPRTERFTLFNVGGSAGHANQTMSYANGYNCINYADAGVPATGNGFSSNPTLLYGYFNAAYPEGWAVNSSSPAASTFMTSDPRTVNAGAPIYYADLDGVVRPGDETFSNTATGDGLMLFTTAGTGSTAVGDTTSTGDGTGNAQHGRRPVILNRPFRSVGELGYAFRDLPFKTLDFFTQSSADAALLDVFSITDQTRISNSQACTLVAGQVGLSNAPVPVVQAILAGGAKKDLDPTYNISTEASMIAQNLANHLNPSSTPGPIVNRADLVTQLSTTLQSGFTTTADNGNKAYLEAPVRALADVTNTRTWNLIIDIIAQSGHMSSTAATLDDFVVEGEKRYWLHVAIDRYTGKIVDQQLEPVYE